MTLNALNFSRKNVIFSVDVIQIKIGSQYYKFIPFKGGLQFFYTLHDFFCEKSQENVHENLDNPVPHQNLIAFYWGVIKNVSFLDTEKIIVKITKH